MKLSEFIAVLLTIGAAQGYAGTAQPAPFALPPMGYASWNHGGGSFPREANALAVTDAIVRRGLKDAGYVYVMAFDGWWCTTQRGKQDRNGNLLPDPDRWPRGIQYVSDYIHSKGLKVAGYSDIGAVGYGGGGGGTQLGGYPHYQQDANQFAAWGWDYIKIDDHNIGGPQSKEEGFTEYCDAVRNNAERRPLFLSLSTPHTPESADFARNIANMWRTSDDICVPGLASFDKVGADPMCACRNFDSSEDFWWNQGPGTWNDIDMLVVGIKGISDLQSQTLMNMWAIRGAPLIIGCNPVTASRNTIDILTNREVIAVDQDPLCAQGRKVREDQPGIQVYSKPLGRFTSGDRAVLLLNRSARQADVTVSWSDLGLTSDPADVRDLVKHEDLGSHSRSFTVKQLAPDDSMLLKITGGTFDWSKPRDYEAESVLNEFGGNAHYHAFAAGFSAHGMVDGIGGDPANTLQFNQVDAPQDGKYILTLYYASQLPPGMKKQDQESVDLSVNGAPPETLRLPNPNHAPKVLAVTETITLKKGFNTIRLSNPTEKVPAIDKLSIQ